MFETAIFFAPSDFLVFDCVFSVMGLLKNLDLVDQLPSLDLSLESSLGSLEIDGHIHDICDSQMGSVHSLGFASRPCLPMEF